jgi:hypothetical protein
VPSHLPHLCLSATGVGLWPTAIDVYGKENERQFIFFQKLLGGVSSNTS